MLSLSALQARAPTVRWLEADPPFIKDATWYSDQMVCYFTLCICQCTCVPNLHENMSWGWRIFKVNVETPTIGFEEMVIPDWVGAGICVGFEDIISPEAEDGGHKRGIQEMKTRKQAVN